MAPGNVSLTPGDGQLAVSWDAPSNPSSQPIHNTIVQYRVQWKSGSQDWDSSNRQAVKELPPTLSHTITGLTNGTEYEVQVRAISSVHDGAWSSAVAESPVAPSSDDATLSGLTLSEGRLMSAFAGGTTEYTASVGYTVSRITVAPTTTDGGATVELLDSGDAALADADTTADGHQVDLAVGENVVKVKVTAADGVATETYTVTVTRTAEDTLLNPPASDPAAPVRSSAVYSATFRGAWTTDVTPGGVPNNAHFTQLVGGVHNADVAFLSGGGTATGGVESVAEDGNPNSFKNEINAAGANRLSVLESETGGSNDYGATGTVAVDNFTLTTDHPRVTLITMIAPSPDWFVGVAGLSLLDADGNWVQSLTVNLYPWDAGTEDGTGFAMVNAATSPQGTITSIRGTGEFSTEPIATLTFARQSVNAAPVFPAAETGARSVDENSPAGASVGDPVAATDTDTLVYSLGGDDSNLFGLDSGTGQISVAAGTDLDYETKTTLLRDRHRRRHGRPDRRDRCDDQRLGRGGAAGEAGRAVGVREAGQQHRARRELERAGQHRPAHR